MPVCLFTASYNKFDYGYVAGFGSQSFAKKCWTSKDGPHPFEECKDVREFCIFIIILYLTYKTLFSPFFFVREYKGRLI